MMSQNSKSSDLILNVETEGNLVASKKNYWKNKTNSEAAFKTTRVLDETKEEILYISVWDEQHYKLLWEFTE